MCVCVRVCVRACVHACVRVYHRCRGSSDYDLYFPLAFLQVCPIQSLKIYCQDACWHKWMHAHFLFRMEGIGADCCEKPAIRRGQESWWERKVEEERRRWRKEAYESIESGRRKEGSLSLRQCFNMQILWGPVCDDNKPWHLNLQIISHFVSTQSGANLQSYPYFA